MNKFKKGEFVKISGCTPQIDTEGKITSVKKDSVNVRNPLFPGGIVTFSFVETHTCWKISRNKVGEGSCFKITFPFFLNSVPVLVN